MLVLVDIEWIEGYSEKNLTQLAALRVDESWNVQDKFSSLACPPSLKNFDWDHVAFNGHNPNDFFEAGREEDCIKSFAEWLYEDDVICVWHYTTQTEMKRFLKKVFPEGTRPRVRHASNKVQDFLLERGKPYGGIYALAEAHGAELLSPAHCANNDVAMLREVLVRIGIPQEAFTQKGLKGFPSNEQNPQTKPIDGVKSLPEHDDSLIYVRLFDDSKILTHPKNIVGYCNSTLHPGKVSKHLLKEHDCLGKKCFYFKKNEQSTYWLHLAEVEKAKENAKKKKLREKDAQQKQADKLAEITEEFWTYLDLTNYTMDIIRVEQVHPQAYNIFYVSDNHFADGNRFPDFLALIKEAHPTWRINLRHIKDEYGHFVTIDEFYSRKRGK